MSAKHDDSKDLSKSNLLKESGLTYDDYAQLDDGLRYELVGGQLELMSPAPSVIHQVISFEMQKRIAQSCETDYLILNAPIDLILSPTEVRQPDLVLIHRSRISEIVSKRGIEGAPDLVVEILSPSTLKRDKLDKLKVYARFSIPEYWIVEPETAVLEAYLLQQDRYQLVNIFQQDEAITSPNISCISLSMAEVTSNIPKLAD